ncbi:MAG: hypothetical protein JKX81_11665 [Arenicella sp.]|nr:hypothetical protein [Arenicella sp.]
MKNLVVQSELIFRGKLIDISEQLSVEQIPYTFVTYQVHEVITGQYFNDTITLKFVGGHFPNGNKLTASNSPEVKLGEESILMVQQSIDTGCDFVDCEKGRFAIEGGKVVAANESAVLVDDEGQVNFVSSTAVKSKSNSTDSNVANFVAYLKSLNKASSSQSKTAQAKSINPNSFNRIKDVPFKAYSALTRASTAPQEINANTSTSQSNVTAKHEVLTLEGSQFDQLEVEQLKNNGGNPLLDTSTSDND